MSIKDLVRLGQNTKRFSVDEKRRAIQAEASSKNTRDPESIRVRTVAPRAGTGTPGQFEMPEVDLVQIGQAYHSESYISRAVDKISGLMFKAGWELTSLNGEALRYVQTRLRLMEESTDIKTEELLRELGRNYVLYANAPIIKTRGQENLASLKVSGYYGGDPISGLFPGNPEAFQVLRDELGNIEQYSFGEGAQAIEIKPEDILHLSYHRPSGRAYGIPYITNTLRDVLILRQVEETVSNILYRNLHPLQTYTVGKDKPGYEAQEGEIEEVQEAIQGASLDSMFVLPERHKIETVSSNSDFLDANGYLKYFRQRVFTGLGVSESTMGIGDTANRSTSDNQSSDVIDLVKDFQQNFSAEFQKIVNELLFEGGYDPTLNPEDRVDFAFTEIEHSAKIARENHEVQKFMMNVQGLAQTRKNIGYEPTEDLSDFYFNFSSNLVDATGTIDNKNQPENQHGKSEGPSKDSMKDSHKSTIIENSQLTSLGRMVTVHSDNAFKNKESAMLSDSWKKTYTVLKEKSLVTKKELCDVLDGSLQESLFSNAEEKELFIETLSGIAMSLTDGWKKEKLQNLYMFEEALSASYYALKNTDRKGG